jgi:hypothetical protein
LLSFPLCDPNSEATCLVVIDELDSGVFERSRAGRGRSIRTGITTQTFQLNASCEIYAALIIRRMRADIV